MQLQKFNSENRVICEVLFTAKDETKKYPHGWGISPTFVAGTSLEDCREAANQFEDDEFAVIGILPVGLYFSEEMTKALPLS